MTSARPTVAVLDYGFGNVRSACRALEQAGSDVTLTSDISVAEDADGLVVPGVGAFAACMAGLRAIGAGDLVRGRVGGGRGVLGICVGMQVMFGSGVEHGTEADGIGVWPGVVERLDAPVLPHMGWNTVEAATGSVLFERVEHERFYFVHSYGVRTWKAPDDPHTPDALVTWSQHGSRFIAAMEHRSLAATQFHPEKSGPAGQVLLGNWLSTL